MGEDTYYLRAVFESKGRAQKIYWELEVLVEDLIKLYEEWQSLRPFSDEDVERIKSYPSYAFIEKGKIPHMTWSYDLHSVETTEGFEIRLTCEVARMTDWTPIVKWLLSRGAKKAGYIPWSYFDPFETWDNYFTSREEALKLGWFTTEQLIVNTI